MKVDGGRSITRRGQVDWLGSHEMVKKFEHVDSSLRFMFFGSKE